LGSGRREQAPAVLRERSTPLEWPGHGEQHRRAAMHVGRGVLAVFQPSRGHHRVRLVAGSMLVLRGRGPYRR